MLGASTPVRRAFAVHMDTHVSIEVVSPEPERTVGAAMDRALGWFGVVEATCSRFDPNSELRLLTAQVGRPVPASGVLFEATRFALALAELTGGAFDPTVGRLLESRGFDRHYVTGEHTPSHGAADASARYRDVRLDPARRTITLLRPLVLDLGAVAKGLAIDLAARELAAYPSFCVDAGGDLYAKGVNAQGMPWLIGIQHPRQVDALVGRLQVSGHAVCTSGDYERRSVDGLEHHLVDPRSGTSAERLASATVVAPTAFAADGLATAAFVLGSRAGLRLLNRQRVGGVLVEPSGQMHTTPGLPFLP